MTQARAKRARRWSRRAQLRKITSIGRVRRCGYCTNPEAGPTLAVTENGDGTRTAGYGGLATCGSVWVCPQCAAKIATSRADELSQVMRAVDAAGGSAFMLTLTMRHTAGDRLGLSMADRERLSLLEKRRKSREAGRLSKKDADQLARLEERDRERLEELGEAQAERDDAEAQGWDIDERQAEADAIEEAEIRARRGCWDACADGWKAVTEGAQWQADKELFGGLLGWAKVVEVTDGLQVCDDPDCSQRRHGNGWHVHIHALLCFGRDVPVELVRETVCALAFGRWCRALERHGFDASEEHGWDVRKVLLGDGDLADYFTKVAHEVTGSHHKEGRRKGGRTPMQLLADAVDTYRVEDLARWWEWEAASQRRQQLTWSRGRHDLRKLAELGHERTDEELAEEDLGDEVRLAIERDSWNWIEGMGRQCELLDIAEQYGLAGARLWLQCNHLECTVVYRELTHANRQGDREESTGRPHDRLFPMGRGDWTDALDWERAVRHVRSDAGGDWHRDPWGWPEYEYALDSGRAGLVARAKGTDVKRVANIDVPKSNPRLSQVCRASRVLSDERCS